jgi:TetR/AcrR family transcriptional repressor of nem operon
MKPATHPRSEKTRQFIIETAAPIFNKKGYAGTSMSDLTAATGLTKGSIYGNFKDKNDVAVHAFQHNIDLIFDFFTKELKAAGSTLEKLLAYPRGFRKIYPMILSYGGCPILNTGPWKPTTPMPCCAKWPCWRPGQMEAKHRATYRKGSLRRHFSIHHRCR